MNRYLDWFRQSHRDLRHAKNALEDEDYEWACFAAQQAAEKALKALVQFYGGHSWGHSILMMLRELKDRVEDVTEQMLEDAAQLDKLYIPTRYPNGFDMGTPADYFNKTDAAEAIARAERLINYVRGKISG